MKNPFPTREQILKTKGALDEIRVYLGGRIDFRAIEQYLNLPSPIDLAKIAALLASSGKPASNPNNLVVRSAELLQDAETHTEHQRLELVARMNRDTLIELALRLGITQTYGEDVYKAGEIDDWTYLSMRYHLSRDYTPLQLPVIRRLGDMDANASAVADGILKVKNPTTLLEIADSRTSLPHPRLGSALEDALRWAVNEPRTSKKSLRAAFRDCVHYSLAQQWLEPMSDLVEEVGEDEALRISHYVDTFEPGIPAPDYIEFHAYSEISDHWAPMFATPGKLAWLAQVFHNFWKKHREEYSKQRPAKDSKGLHTKRKHAGKKGATDRENRTYLMHSQNFVSFLGDRQIPHDRDARRKLLTDFAREHSNRRTKEAQAYIVDFLDILYVHRKEEPAEILSRLHQHRLLEFNGRPEKEKMRIAAKLKPYEKSLLKRGHAPKTLLRGWGFDESGIRSCFEVIRPTFEPKRMSPEKH